MQLDLIKEIVSGIVGKDGEKIVEILYKKKNINEFVISKKLNLTINQTRNLLYKLSDKGLIHFIRKKDRKKGGWYIYFWTLDIKRSLGLLKEQIANKIENLNAELQKRKSERFYYSPGSELEYTEEEALEHNFICPETGEVLELKDNKELVERIEINILKLKILIEELSKELEEIEKKRNKEKVKKMALEIKKKEKERKIRRLKKLKEKLKLSKKERKKNKKIEKIKRKIETFKKRKKEKIKKRR